MTPPPPTRTTFEGRPCAAPAPFVATSWPWRGGLPKVGPPGESLPLPPKLCNILGTPLCSYVNHLFNLGALSRCLICYPGACSLHARQTVFCTNSDSSMVFMASFLGPLWQKSLQALSVQERKMLLQLCNHLVAGGIMFRLTCRHMLCN